MAAERGTRPGDPLADLLYAFAMAGALQDTSSETCVPTPALHLAGVLSDQPPTEVSLPPSISWQTQLSFSVLTGPWTWRQRPPPVLALCGRRSTVADLL